MASLPVAPPRAAAPLAQRALTAVPAADVVAVFAHDPDLLRGVDPGHADLLRHRARAPRVWLDAGPWTLDDEALAGAEPALGLLVLDGLLLRTVQLDGRDCPELTGAGDVLRPWDQAEDPCELGETTWQVLVPSTVAVLDATFTEVACRFPLVVRNLLARAVQRTRLLSVQMAIAHVRHAETRLEMLLWHLADRWGRVTPAGVHPPLPLKQELLAHLACMRRPTASTVLARLQRQGLVARRPDGTWLLLGERPGAMALPTFVA